MASSSQHLPSALRGMASAAPAHSIATPNAIVAQMLEQLSDEALVARYQREAPSAAAEPYVNELFHRHHSRIARWCLRFTTDRATAADLAQEICARAYQNLGSFQGDSKFTTWLYSIARNHCLNAARARAAEPAMDNEEEIFATLSDTGAGDPERALERQAAAALARQILEQTLDETEKQVFTLHFAEELSLDVITRLLGLTNASGAKAYVVSARRKLRRAVERWNAVQRRSR